MKNELKAKDDEYVKTLKRQAEDIETILGAMGSQFRELQSALLEELDEIEQSFLQERRELLDGQKGEISNLFERRSTMEAQFMEAMQQRAEQYQQALETQRVQDAEEYSILKIRLETDIQNLEQHLEAMRATYQVREASMLVCVHLFRPPRCTPKLTCIRSDFARFLSHSLPLCICIKRSATGRWVQS
jgi:dynein regulatory complex protein 1